MAALAPTGSAPSRVSNLAAATSTSNSIPVTYGGASGTAPINYSGFVAAHGTSAWTQNSGSFSDTGGTFVGLASGSAYDCRIVASNAFGTSSTDLLTGTSTLSSAATSFTVSLSRSSGPAGTPVTLTVTPVSAAWPPGQVVSPTVSGLAGSFDNSSLVGSGVTPLVFTFTPISVAAQAGSFAATAAGMANSSGAQGYTVSASATSVVANRYDMILSTSAVAAGSAVQVSVYPNASFPSGTITLSGTNGTFSPSPTITLTRSSTAPVTVTYTPASAGEHSIASTNSSGLYNPYPAPLNVFSGASGVPQSLAVSLTRSDMVTYQRDAPSGNPSGFSLPWSKGWGEVWLNVTAIAGPTNGLWVRLYDALSGGASAAAGSGAALHPSPVQVYGSIAGATVARFLLPAGPYIYYADVATDAAFTNPVRIAQRFRVGVVLGLFTRSFECGLVREWADGGTSFSPVYTKTASWVSQDHRYGAWGANWFLQDGGMNTYAYEQGEHTSLAAEEFGRLIEAQLGVCVGITGSAEAGGDFDACVNHDGSLSDGFAGTVGASVGNKFRYFWGAHSGWQAVDPAYPTETHAEVRTRIFAAADYIARHYPACAVIGWTQGASGQFGSDGSRATGYTRNTLIVLNELEPGNAMVVSKESYLWNEYVNSHASMGARIDYARPSFRKLMAAELAVMGGLQTAARGPKLASTGTLNTTARTITIPFTLGAGTSLLAVGATYSNPTVAYNTATAAEIAGLFSVYLPGLSQDTGKAVKIDGAIVDNTAKTVTLTLTGTSGITFADGTTAAMPSGFSVCYAADFGASNGAIVPGSGRSAMLADDRIGNGIPYGWHMLPALDLAISAG
ncbi:MAG: hypothetical protein RQ966_09395 [Acetobacteraceae bacterium]|nr:hypothetical protein [Acetobacteraceae bacterium]